MKRDGGGAAVWMAVLPVRSALADLGKPNRSRFPGDLPWLEDRDVAHLRDLDGLRADKLAFQLGLAVLEKHRHDFF